MYVMDTVTGTIKDIGASETESSSSTATQTRIGVANKAHIVDGNGRLVSIMDYFLDADGNLFMSSENPHQDASVMASVRMEEAEQEVLVPDIQEELVIEQCNAVDGDSCVPKSVQPRQRRRSPN